jgi:hypothetical protein
MKDKDIIVFVDDRDVNRRINYLMSEMHAPFAFKMNDFNLDEFVKTAYFFAKLLGKNSKYLNKTKHSEQVKELYKLLIDNDLLTKETAEKWLFIRNNYAKKRSTYKLKPLNRKKDNNGVYVGSGGGNKNSVRAPKLKRKTAWKRFLALFPNYKGKKPKNLK